MGGVYFDFVIFCYEIEGRKMGVKKGGLYNPPLLIFIQINSN